MKTIKSKWSNGEESETYIYDFREIEDPEKFNIYDGSIFIELDYCPFCKAKGIMNRNNNNYFGWCSICGARGPEHWNWIEACKLWNCRSTKEYFEIKKLSPKKLIDNGFDWENRLDEDGKKYFQQFKEN